NDLSKQEEDMPIYEYKCKDCGGVSEFIVFGKDDELHCKSCNSENLEKLLSAHNTMASSGNYATGGPAGGCCGAPNSCGSPGSCCGG
ncbi:MAG: zinc ribbon domain-containing protein, partial [Proteobacteria bacterium]|nr:zinc ribbon domain-containing protein [Pseudomonadota bacterium]